jgi:hypothetical protein
MTGAKANWISVSVLAVLAFTHPALSADIRSINQVPLALLANKIILTSIGNIPLKISYLKSDWAEIEIQPGDTFSFPQTGQAVSVRFHDGAEVQTLNLSPSTQYILFFNSQSGRWAIDSFDSVMKAAGTGLRSH